MSLAAALVLALWGAFAVSVVLRLRRRGRAAFDDRFTPDDRRLSGATAFYLVAPALALAAQAAELAILSLGGARIEGAQTWVYWGVVEADAADALRAASLAAGPALLAGAALSLIGWTRLGPSRAAVNHLRLESARVIVTLVCGVQPVASLLTRRGAWHELHAMAEAWFPRSGDAGLLAFGVLAAAAFWRLRAARRLWALASPLHDARRRAERALDQDDADPAALRDLAATQLVAGDPRADETLERAEAAAPDDPRVALLRGRAAAMRGDPEASATHLRRAGQLLEAGPDDPALFFEIALALGDARLRLGDAEGARLTAEAAREAVPGDLRAAVVLADAQALGGQLAEARRTLEKARERAEGALRRRIERRLRALR